MLKKTKYFWVRGTTISNFDLLMDQLLTQKNDFITSECSNLAKIASEEFINIQMRDGNVIMIKLNYFTKN